MALASPWTPFLISLALLSLAQLLSFLLPETLGYAAQNAPDSSQARRSDAGKKSNRNRRFALAAGLIVQNRNRAPIIIVNLVASITKSSTRFLLQDYSTKYGWFPYIAAGLFFITVLLAVCSIRVQSRNLDEDGQPLLQTDV